MASPTWRGGRGSCGGLRGSRAAVVLHLKAQVRYSDPLKLMLVGLICLFSLLSGRGGLTDLLGAC